MRNSFWDHVSRQSDLKKEMMFLEKIFCESKFYLDCYSCTLINYIDRFYFLSWAAENKITYPTIGDLRSEIGIERLKKAETLDVANFLLYLECTVNLINIVFEKSEDNDALEIAKNMYFNISTNCERLNFKIVEFSKNLLKIVEKNAATTAVADKYSGKEPDLSFKVIEYNHFLLRGNIDRKREILCTIVSKFEAVRPLLKSSGFKELESDAGFLVNNLNIRYNNTDAQSRSHIPHVANMRPDELEKWYDKTYDVLLLTLLASDFSAQHKDILNLRQQFER